MARPQKEGLDYFPLDVDIDQDDKVQLIEAQFGVIGFGILIKLFMKIYKEGYFYEWTEKEQLLFSRRVNVDINQVNDVINECLKWGLFDQKLYKKYSILTSKGIQRRYMEAVGRRKQVQIIKEYFLLDQSKYSNIIFVNINPINDDNNTISEDVNVSNNPQSKVKKSKVKESKGKNIFIPPTLEEVRAYCQERNNGVDPQKWYDFYSAKGWMIGKNKMKDWKAAVRTWERGQKGVHNSRETPTMSRNVENALRLVEKYALEEGGYP